MQHLQKLSFELENGIYKHKRAPLRGITSHGDTRIRLIYDLGQEVLSSLMVDVDNTEHEILMVLTDIKKVLVKLGVVK